MNLDEFVATRKDVPEVKNKTIKPSADWVPGVEMTGGKGSITTKAIPKGNPNWKEYLGNAIF